MKKENNLFELCSNFENLINAYKKAIKGTSKTKESLRFYYNYENELLKIKEELTKGLYKPGKYRYFSIKDPKERTIMVAPFRDRVVHHALIAVLEPIFEKSFYFHSYACRKNKGSHRAILYAQKCIKKNNWYLKADIKSYFASIDHGVLLKTTGKKIKDKKILELTRKIIENGGINGKGLPIGNLTSQFFANMYLDNLDRFVKEKCREKFYVRYMDDFVVFSNDKDKLKTLKKQIETYLKENLFLDLKVNATYINKSLNGLSFLGRRIFSSTIRIKNENLKRSIKKIKNRNKEYKNGLISDDKYQASMASFFGYITSANSFALLKNIELG